MKSPARNPYIFLLQTSWNYARAERKQYVIIYIFFMLSNLANSMIPVLWGLFINDIQQNGHNALAHAWKYVFIWALNSTGPSRSFTNRRTKTGIQWGGSDELYHKTYDSCKVAPGSSFRPLKP
jgi:ABC-type multidrug transport system fused ATPase/permease subunit